MKKEKSRPEMSIVLQAQLIRRIAVLGKEARFKLEAEERQEFDEAKLNGVADARSCAEAFGLVLAMDMCKEIAPFLREDIDREQFGELFVSALGKYTLLDYDEEWAKKVAALANIEGLFTVEQQ